jgi:hypothetical protein
MTNDFEKFRKDMSDSSKVINRITHCIQASEDIRKHFSGNDVPLLARSSALCLGSITLAIAFGNQSTRDVLSLESPGKTIDRIPSSFTREGPHVVIIYEVDDQTYILTSWEDGRISADFYQGEEKINHWDDRSLHDHIQAVWELTGAPDDPE